MICSKVKLVIWDLDETFWRGTLSEGQVEGIGQNIDIVHKLIDRGIMCSIVSKNDYSEVEKKTERVGIVGLFYFSTYFLDAKRRASKAFA